MDSSHGRLTTDLGCHIMSDIIFPGISYRRDLAVSNFLQRACLCIIEDVPNQRRAFANTIRTIQVCQRCVKHFIFAGTLFLRKSVNSRKFSAHKFFIMYAICHKSVNSLYSQTPLIRPSLIQLFPNPAKKLLEQICPY